MSQCKVFDPQEEITLLRRRLEIVEKWCASLEERLGQKVVDNASFAIEQAVQAGLIKYIEENA